MSKKLLPAVSPLLIADVKTNLFSRSIMRNLLLSIAFILPITLNAQSIPMEVKSTVAFVYVEDSGKLVPNGTAFFVGVQDVSKQDRYSVYLVTAKHVLINPQKKYFSDIYIRINKKDSGSQFVPISLKPTGRNKNIFIHEDSTVDIAVIPALPNEKIFDYLFLPDSYLTDKNSFSELKIQEGTEVFFTGLFTPFVGEKRNFPIVRFGRVALVTNEKIPWDGIKTEMYLIESSSYGGNSGSPVFFYIGAVRGDGSIHLGNPILKLAGVMKGFFGQKTPIEVVNTQTIPVSVNNIGIAAVTPAHFLQEILLGKELKKSRGF